jgi:hypothetical protein
VALVPENSLPKYTASVLAMLFHPWSSHAEQIMFTGSQTQYRSSGLQSLIPLFFAAKTHWSWHSFMVLIFQAPENIIGLEHRTLFVGCGRCSRNLQQFWSPSYGNHLQQY